MDLASWQPGTHLRSPTAAPRADPRATAPYRVGAARDGQVCEGIPQLRVPLIVSHDSVCERDYRIFRFRYLAQLGPEPEVIRSCILIVAKLATQVRLLQ